MSYYSRFFIFLGLILNLFAAISLYYGSRETPWDIQTWSGESDKEKSFKSNRKLITSIGFIILFLGFLLQLIETLIN